MADEPYHDYWRALGQMIHEFAVVEFLMAIYVAQLAGVKLPLARAVFSGSVRVKGAMEMARRIHASKGEPIALEPVFNQLIALNGFRNDLVHHGGHHAGEGRFSVTNYNEAHTPAKLRTFEVQVDLLEGAITDLRKIQHHIGVETGAYPATDDRIAAVLAASWLYKSQQPAREPTRNPEGTRARRRQRQSSRP